MPPDPPSRCVRCTFYIDTSISATNGLSTSYLLPTPLDSDVPEVIMKRRQHDAQAKAAKHCSTENRQQEAQAIAAKHRSE